MDGFTQEVPALPMVMPARMPTRRRSSAKAVAFTVLLAAAAIVYSSTFAANFERNQSLESALEGYAKRYDRQSSEGTTGLSGGGQEKEEVTSCMSGKTAAGMILEPVEPPAPPPPPSAGKVGFFPEIGKLANGLVKFGVPSRVNLTLNANSFKGLKVTGLAMKNPFAGPDAETIKIKGEGSQGKIGYWVGANVAEKKLEGGIAAKTTIGEGKNLNMYLSGLVPNTKSLEAEAVYLSPKLRASVKTPKLTPKGTGLIESSAAVAVNDKLKVVGAVVANPSALSLANLKTSSAFGAQYTTPDYTVAASTEGLGASSKVTVSTKVGDNVVGVAGTVKGFMKSPVIAAGVSIPEYYGVKSRAGIATDGIVDVELTRKLVDHVALKVGAKVNLNDLGKKPQMGAQINIDAGI